MIKHFIIFIAIFYFINNSFAQNINEKSVSASSKIKYNLIPLKNNTWGYDIFIDDKLKIHQTTIPCLNGDSGFKTKASAKNIAKLVTYKISKGIMPPSITIDELKKNKAI